MFRQKNIKKAKICILIPRLGVIDRGAESFAYELVKRLVSGFRITIFVRKSTQKSPLINELKKKGVEIKYIRSIPASHIFAKFFYNFPKLRPFLDKFHLNPGEIEMLSFSLFSFFPLIFFKCDLLFPINGIWGAMLCRIIRFIKNTPFVYSSQGGQEPLIAGQKPDIYFAIHPHTKVWLDKYFPNLKTVYIPNGVDLKRFCPRGPKIRLGLPRPVIMTAAALIPQKRVDLTIKAVGRLKKGSLLILGDGPLKSNLLRLGQKLIAEKRLKILSISQSQIQKYYRSADVFVFTAPWELGWGIVHLEALACGLPVVANFDSDLRQLINMTKGVVCDVTDRNQYAQAIGKALKITDRSVPKQMKQFDWELIARKYRQNIFKVLRNRNN